MCGNLRCGPDGSGALCAIGGARVSRQRCSVATRKRYNNNNNNNHHHHRGCLPTNNLCTWTNNLCTWTGCKLHTPRSTCTQAPMLTLTRLPGSAHTACSSPQQRSCPPPSPAQPHPCAPALRQQCHTTAGAPATTGVVCAHRTQGVRPARTAPAHMHSSRACGCWGAPMKGMCAARRCCSTVVRTHRDLCTHARSMWPRAPTPTTHAVFINAPRPG